jgi:hypothetical protein
MVERLALNFTGTGDPGRDLDLRDEAALLAADRAEYDIAGVRALLAAINLQPVGSSTDPSRHGEVMDLAIYRATGSRSLARIFSNGS